MKAVSLRKKFKKEWSYLEVFYSCSLEQLVLLTGVDTSMRRYGWSDKLIFQISQDPDFVMFDIQDLIYIGDL